jgi:outer membrane protein TolC
VPEVPVSHPVPAAGIALLLALPLALLMTAGAAATRAQESPRPLLPREVLESSAQHYPGILKALAELQLARGKALAAEGAFDLVFSVDGFSRVDGYYDGSVLDSSVKQALPGMGASLYSGYKISRGDFPVYEDEYFTNLGGQFKVGVLFALLRDREIDSRRFQRRDSELATAQASLDLLLTRIGVQQRALIAYWRWVAAGRQLQVYEELLRIALHRESGLEEEVESGRRARIFLTENRQSIIRRQRLKATAQRDFRIAATELSFYYRDERGARRSVSIERLPEQSLTESLSEPPLASEDISLAATERPELQRLRLAMERTRRAIDLSENNLKPRLDLNLELAQGLGDEGQGGPSRDSTDAIVGFSFSLPLGQRAARGRLSEARAKLTALEQEQRLLQDRIEMELTNIVLSLDVAHELARLARDEVQQAEAMRRAEQQRFDQGASDFFLVNVREEEAANARIRYHSAFREARIARANFEAATVNLEKLVIAEQEASR